MIASAKDERLKLKTLIRLYRTLPYPQGTGAYETENNRLHPDGTGAKYPLAPHLNIIDTLHIIAN